MKEFLISENKGNMEICNMTYNVIWKNKYYGTEDGFKDKESANRFINRVCMKIDNNITAFIK